jgi:hypothetical protein
LGDASERRPWSEGPDEEAPPESWLLLDDDDLLHRIETIGSEADEDEHLLEVVASDRHFFIRQEAAKRVRERSRLFAFEDDRHIGQILVRLLTRREDVTYLERLSARSNHVEVRSAAQVQIARLWQRLDAPEPPADPPPAAPEAPAAVAMAPAPGAPAPAPEPVTSAALEKGGVDGSLLGWAAHFLVEQAWSQLGTQGTHELLTRTRRELVGRHPTLVFFEITRDAHVATNLAGGPRLPRDAVCAVAAWMTAFRAAVRDLAPRVENPSVRAATAMMADALRDAGFYTACDEMEAGRRA